MTNAHSDVSAVLEVDVQIALAEKDEAGDEPPSPGLLSRWAKIAYGEVCAEPSARCSKVPSEVTIRLVGRPEVTSLNRDYRGKDEATNVLSFPFEATPEIELGLLGDIVICHAVIKEEANEQNKSVHNHYAHMVTHGMLHLCGYDHQDDRQAEQMESLETKILAQSGIANPY